MLTLEIKMPRTSGSFIATVSENGMTKVGFNAVSVEKVFEFFRYAIGNPNDLETVIYKT